MSESESRRTFVGRLALGGAALLWSTRRAEAAAPAVRVTVYKDPQCGCCTNWNAAMQRAGFEIAIRDTPDLASVKQTLGIPTRLASCHTGVANGYLFEGHVPPDLVTRVLRERPAIVGLFVPGMPMGSPGMEGPNPERYEVLALDRTGRTTVYAVRMGRATV